MLRPKIPDRQPPDDRQGWRIARIDPRAGENRKATYGVPILLFLALISMGGLLALLVAPLVAQADANTPFLSLLTPAHIFLIVLVLVFATPMAFGLVAAVRRLIRGAQWVEVEAVCIDRDIQPVTNETEEAAEQGWSYRLLCRFELNDATVEATPDGYDGERYRLFATPQAVAAYLDDYVDPDGRARLRVNEWNPLDVRLVLPRAGGPEDEA